MKTAVIVRHVAFEDLGHFEPVLRAAGYSLRYLDVGDPALHTPEPVTADLLVVLGGPIGVYESERYPFLHDELAALEQRIAADRPTLGICLGAQLIAAAAGARVYPAGVKEIGYAPIQLSAAGAHSCLAPYGEHPLVLHWHGDTFDLPTGAVHLASSELCRNQAFSLGENVLAIQFHPETPVERIERWLVGHAVELASAGIDPRRIREQAAACEPTHARVANDVLAAWLGRRC